MSNKPLSEQLAELAEMAAIEIRELAGTEARLAGHRANWERIHAAVRRVQLLLEQDASPATVDEAIKLVRATIAVARST